MSAVGFQSDSNQLVEACLAQLRIDARLDDDPVLPPIELLPDEVIDVDPSEVELVIVCESATELPSAASIVRDSVRANQVQKDVPTIRKMNVVAPVRKSARWPVMLCALVATYCGVTAFLKSPLGAKPEVQHVVKVARAHAAGALHTTKSLSRL